MSSIGFNAVNALDLRNSTFVREEVGGFLFVSSVLGAFVDPGAGNYALELGGGVEESLKNYDVGELGDLFEVVSVRWGFVSGVGVGYSSQSSPSLRQLEAFRRLR